MLKKGTKAIVIGLVVLLLFLGLWYINRPEEGFLGQDLSLIDSNGRIVYLEPLTIKSEYAGRVEYYRLRYLSDGLNVVGFLMKPKGTGVYPAIIYNRGGSLEYFKIDASRLRVLSFLPANGYVVVATQYRGNDGGEGREEYGGSDVNDVLNLLPLLESLPFVDSDRIGMYGWSRGGMETYIAITRTDKIKAAVVGGGVTDLIQTCDILPAINGGAS